jgi:hypothetical protein
VSTSVRSPFARWSRASSPQTEQLQTGGVGRGGISGSVEQRPRLRTQTMTRLLCGSAGKMPPAIRVRVVPAQRASSPSSSLGRPMT